MPRINVVPPSELNDRQLVAEYHDLHKTFGYVTNEIKAGKKSKDYRDQFTRYTLGSGHLKFFYGRLKFVAHRYIEVTTEMITRKMKPDYGSFNNLIANIPRDWFDDWTPGPKDLAINREGLAGHAQASKRKAKRKPLTPYNQHLMDDNGEIR